MSCHVTTVLDSLQTCLDPCDIECASFLDMSIKTGVAVKLFCYLSLQKATLVSAVDVYEEEESELLISFNRKSFFLFLFLTEINI